MSKYSNHKEIIALIDREGNILKKKEQKGWQNDSIKEEFDGGELIREGDYDKYDEANLSFSTETYIHSALLYEEITTVYVNDEKEIGSIVYSKECEFENNKGE